MDDRPMPPVRNIDAAIEYLEEVLIPREEALATETAFRRWRMRFPLWVESSGLPYFFLAGMLGGGGWFLARVFSEFGWLLFVGMWAIISLLYGGHLLLDSLMTSNLAVSSSHESGSLLSNRWELKILGKFADDLRDIAEWNPEADVGFTLRGDHDFDRVGVRARIRQLQRQRPRR